MTSTAAVARQRPPHPQASETEAVLKSAGSAVSSIIRRMAEARARARTTRILQSLDDYALKDIGVVRSRIDTIEHDFRYTPRFRRWQLLGART